jgi:hypothetical protein
MKCVRIFVGFLLLSTACLARADVIVDNVDEDTGGYFGPIGDDSNTNDFLIGQEFTLPTGTNLYDLDEISLVLEPTNGGGNITVSIWSASRNNTPGNEIAALAPVMVTNQGEVNFAMSSSVRLSPGTYYVVASPTSPADNGRVSWGVSADTDWTGSGTLGGYADTESGNWLAYPITDFPQQLTVIATPDSSAILKMNRQGGALKLSWPSGLTGYELDSTTNLTVPAWQSVTNVPVTLSGTNTVTNSLSGPMRFYRLRQDFVVSNLSETVGSWDGPIGMGTNANGFLLGEEWTVPSGPFTVGKVALNLNPVGGSAHITASIWNVSPENTPGSEIDMIATQMVSAAGNVTFIPPSPITLPAGSYFLVAGAATPSDSGKVGWNWTYSSSWTGFGVLDGYAGTTNGVWQTASVAEGPYLISIQAGPP